MKILYIAMGLMMLNGLSAQAQDTSCGIVWGPAIQLSPDSATGNESGPTIAVQGDTVHITWLTSGYKFPYRRSVDNGASFEPLRALRSDTGYVQGSRFLATSKFLAGFYLAKDSVWIMRSFDHGETWDTSNSVTSALVGNESLAGKGDSLFLFNRSGDSWKLLRSFNGGQSWDSVGRLISGISAINPLTITDSILHEVHRYRFDSAGQGYDLVVQYIKSTNWGETWTDSIALSTIATQVASEPHIASDASQTGNSILTVWKDAKYGCLVPGGCAILGRVSHDRGISFGPERRFDQHAAGALSVAAVGGNTMVVAWTDLTVPIEPTMRLTLSMDSGLNWCGPIVIDSGSTPKITLRGSDLHVVWHRNVGGSTGVLKSYYKKGIILPSSVQDVFMSTSAAKLQQNYPNPFNPKTRIEFNIPGAIFASLKVFDMLGREVATLLEGSISPGKHLADWDGREHSSGLYFYRLITIDRGNVIRTLSKSMIMVK